MSPASTIAAALAAGLVSLAGCAAAPGDAEPAPKTAAPAPELAAEPVASSVAAPGGSPGEEPAPGVALAGDFVQGGLVFGQTLPGARATLDGKSVMVSEDGKFALGFGRDHGTSAVLVVTQVDGQVVRRDLSIADRDFPVDRIDGLDQSKVSGFTKEQLAKIEVDKEKKKNARALTDPTPHWARGFSWPVTGRISGVFGSQRILNGEAKTPHSGVDVAAPAGTPVKAPAPGIVRLADSDMYFEGGLVFIDHGQWLESAFLHLSRIDVKPGQKVAAGEVIGAVGATGRATGPHMHWSLKWAGTLVDPQLVAGEMPVAAAAGGGGDALD